MNTLDRAVYNPQEIIQNKNFLLIKKKPEVKVIKIIKVKENWHGWCSFGCLFREGKQLCREIFNRRDGPSNGCNNINYVLGSLQVYKRRNG